MTEKLGLVIFIALISMSTLASNTQRTKAATKTIGVSTTDGRVEIWFHSFDTAQSLDFYPYEPETAGYIFAWVDLSIKNVGSEDVHINWNYAYLKDADNYLYTGRHADSPKEFPLLKLPPEETIRGEFYFEIPTESIIEEFIWSDLRSYVSVVIPEFPSFLLLPLFMLATLLAVIVYRRKHAI